MKFSVAYFSVVIDSFQPELYFTLGPIKDFLSVAKECLYLCSPRIFEAAGTDDGHQKMGLQELSRITAPLACGAKSKH